jgi:hypothetical protein
MALEVSPLGGALRLGLLPLVGSHSSPIFV